MLFIDVPFVFKYSGDQIEDKYYTNVVDISLKLASPSIGLSNYVQTDR